MIWSCLSILVRGTLYCANVIMSYLNLVFISKVFDPIHIFMRTLVPLLIFFLSQKFFSLFVHSSKFWWCREVLSICILAFCVNKLVYVLHSILQHASLARSHLHWPTGVSLLDKVFHRLDTASLGHLYSVQCQMN